MNASKRGNPATWRETGLVWRFEDGAVVSWWFEHDGLRKASHTARGRASAGPAGSSGAGAWMLDRLRLHRVLSDALSVAGAVAPFIGLVGGGGIGQAVGALPKASQ